MVGGPLPDIFGAPDLAHREFDFGFGPVVAADQLVDALAADAEEFSDLRVADKVSNPRCHRHKTTRYLTTSHMTIMLVM